MCAAPAGLGRGGEVGGGEGGGVVGGGGGVGGGVPPTVPPAPGGRRVWWSGVEWGGVCCGGKVGCAMVWYRVQLSCPEFFLASENPHSPELPALWPG